MGLWSYVSLDTMKQAVSDSGTTSDDAAYRRALEAASEEVDRHCRRTFRNFVATKYFTPRFSDRLDIDDLVSVTQIATDTTDNYDYTQIWAGTDYFLTPFNAPAQRQPYWRIIIRPNGIYRFRIHYQTQTTKVVGTWGYFTDLETVASILTSALTASTPTIPVTSGADFNVLQTILVDSEQMYITAIVANNLTVTRGVNGTTAATHLINAPIQRYVYPSPVVQATMLLAGRYFLRPKAPFGVMGSPDVGFVRLKAELDPDAQKMLASYVRERLGVV